MDRDATVADRDFLLSFCDRLDVLAKLQSDPACLLHLVQLKAKIRSNGSNAQQVAKHCQSSNSADSTALTNIHLGQ